MVNEVIQPLVLSRPKLDLTARDKPTIRRIESLKNTSDRMEEQLEATENQPLVALHTEAKQVPLLKSPKICKVTQETQARRTAVLGSRGTSADHGIDPHKMDFIQKWVELQSPEKENQDLSSKKNISDVVAAL